MGSGAGAVVGGGVELDVCDGAGDDVLDGLGFGPRVFVGSRVSIGVTETETLTLDVGVGVLDMLSVGVPVTDSVGAGGSPLRVLPT